MSRRISDIPLWAYTNTALLAAPVLLGFGVFGMWFVPNPKVRIPALVLLVGYYIVVIHICKRTSGVKSFWTSIKASQSGWRDFSFGMVGVAMFGFSAFCCFYITCAAWFTSLTGSEVQKNFTVVAFHDPYQRRCDYKLILSGIAPAFNKAFCVNNRDKPGNWTQGTNVVLYGKESLLGFRITRIGS